MRRHLPRLLMTGALLSPVTLHALGLGEIRLDSALNQPFEAEIELLSPTQDELDNLKVGLAAADLFARYDIDRPAFLSGFEFAIVRAGSPNSAIRVSSSRPVTEPFVTLLVEVSWGRGRLLREYTVLLDPPVFMPAQSQPAPLAMPQAGAQSEGRIERAPSEAAHVQQAFEPEADRQSIEPPAAAAAPAPSAAPAPQAPAPAAGGYATTATGQDGEYVVARNDTLWQIAQAVNPGARSTIDRTMIALFRANPQAFNGNINRLLAGSVLRIPPPADIETISSTEASAEVARQAAEWSGALPVAADSEASRLRLVTPEEPSPDTAALADRHDGAAAASAPAADGADAADASDRRVAIDSETLAGLQQEQTLADEAAAPDGAAAAQDDAPVPAQQQEQPAAAPASRAAQEPVGASLLERLSAHWWIPLVAGLLVVLALLLALIRRRREEAETQAAFAALEPRFEQPEDSAAQAMAPVPRPPLPSTAPDRAASRPATAAVAGTAASAFTPAPQPEPMEFLSEEELRSSDAAAGPASLAPDDVDGQPMSSPAAPQVPAVAAEAAEDTLSSETAVRLDSQDALAEADFHMAYGLYDQAADLIKIAIGREPARRDLRLKLLEIYFVWGNKELFLDAARALHASREEAAAGEWDKVLIMGRQIAGEDPLFQAEAGEAHVDLVDVNLEGGENRVDVDLFAEPGVDGDTTATGLDLQFTNEEDESPVQALAPRQADEDLDFLLEDASSSVEDDAPTLDPLARTQETPTVESPRVDLPTAEMAALDAPTMESAMLATEERPVLPETTLGGSVLHGEALDEEQLAGKGLGDIDPDLTMLAPAATVEAALHQDGQIDRASQTVREQVDQTVLARYSTDQTAELSIDDLGLDVDALEPSALEDTGSLEHDPAALLQVQDAAREEAAIQTREFSSLLDDEATLPPSSDGFDRTLEVPRVIQPDPGDTGTIHVGAEPLDADEAQPVDVDATASMKMPEDIAELAGVSQDFGLDLDLNLDDAEAPATGGDTVEQRRPQQQDAERFSSEVFDLHAAQEPSVDLDLGEPLSSDDDAPTNRQSTDIMELSELDPVTMSEVGTKLDLARAYMDMGDPDGARSILDEVIVEGNPSQKQEAERLLDSIR